jgi:exosortase C (VPDSG-CTERM-specific)
MKAVGTVAADRNRILGVWRSLSGQHKIRIGSCLGWLFVVTLAYVQPLTQLMVVSIASDLNSYIPLVPPVAAYLLYLRRRNLPSDYRSSVVGAAILCLVGSGILFAAIRLSASLSVNDRLALLALSYVAILTAGAFLFLGSKWVYAAAFPVAFMLFIVPLPDAAVYQIETASVLASADVSAWLFRLTGTPLLRDGTILTLPGISLKVAQECSGIHSSWILFITSLVASHLFLDSPWRRLILVAFVFPLAIIRNSVRILVIGLLCVHIGPEMIYSYIHSQGGPIFFALSLIPLFLLLVWLRRQER